MDRPNERQSNPASLSLRRLRANAKTRELTRQVRLSVDQFIQPYFVAQGLDRPEPVIGLTGVHRETPASLLTQVEADLEQGVSKALLFGVPNQKHAHSFDFEFTANQIYALKKRFGDQLWVAVDVCLCSYTDHGHCGILNDQGSAVLNAPTVQSLSQAALAYAQAGADCVAPSDMMDGRVAEIRKILDQNQKEEVLIMSYASKFNSALYGPFRNAANSAPATGLKISDRSSYQIDPANPLDALRSAKRDADEGADILMVKPGLYYLDILSQLSKEITLPWAVYEVSGEYASVELLAEHNLVKAPQAHLEAWTAFVRAGASCIISYGARHAKEWIHGKK